MDLDKIKLNLQRWHRKSLILLQMAIIWREEMTFIKRKVHKRFQDKSDRPLGSKIFSPTCTDLNKRNSVRRPRISLWI